MIGEVLHIGLIVSDMHQSKAFYGDILGLDFVGEMVMQGEATDRLFGMENTVAEVAYFKGTEEIHSPSIELISFEHGAKKVASSLNHTSIAEVCFAVQDIEATYQRLKKEGIEFISEPQFFDFTTSGFDKSWAVYFKDPDGIILELIQVVK